MNYRKNIKQYLILTLLIIGFASNSYSQSLNLGFLFNSGAILGLDYYTPSAMNDSVDFESIKYKVQFTQALKTKVGIDLAGFDFKKMDAKASQIFLTYGFHFYQPRFSRYNNLENLYHGNIGITALTASLRKGIWLYSGNIYIDENSTTLTQSPMPNFRAYMANVQVKNLKFMTFYGAGVVVNQGKIYPFPVVGFRSRLAKKWRLELVVPSYVKLNYKANSKINLDFGTSFSGINSVYREGSAFQDNHTSLNLRRVRSYLTLNAKLGNHYKLRTELGYSYLQEINDVNTDYSLKLENAPYAGITINYYFGKSVFGNFVNRVE